MFSDADSVLKRVGDLVAVAESASDQGEGLAVGNCGSPSAIDDHRFTAIFISHDVANAGNGESSDGPATRGLADAPAAFRQRSDGGEPMGRLDGGRGLRILHRAVSCKECGLKNPSSLLGGARKTVKIGYVSVLHSVLLQFRGIF